jgi:membrane protein DedA with SNARE-associated domain
MVEELIKTIPVFLLSMVKFIFGPVVGFATHLHFITTVFVTIGGMMSTVVGFTYFGDWMRKRLLQRYFKNRKKFTALNRRMAGVWKRYGLIGIAILTPIIFTPIGGTLLAVSSGSPKERIIFYMFVSAAGWSLIFSTIVYFLGREFLPDFVK